jgi:hypothetical protein
MMLLTCSATAPSNILLYNGYLAQVVTKDMYPTDEIYEVIFDFSESESPFEQFEDLEYEGANFLELTGSLLINLGLTSLIAIYKSLSLYCSKKFYMYEFMRKNGGRTQNSNHLKLILDIYLQGYLEVFLSGVLSLMEV